MIRSDEPWLGRNVLSQSLIQAASAPAGAVTPEFADLVLLVNPAIEGARYIPIYDLVSGATFNARTTKQLPVFICAQANNDQPVGLVFPLGDAGHAITEATIGDLEMECVTHALGFVPSFRTHALAGPTEDKLFVLDPPGITEANPFWVVGAAKEVIDGHGGIWQTPFLQFIASLVFQHVQASKKGRGVAADGVTSGRPTLGRSRVVCEIHRRGRIAQALRQTEFHSSLTVTTSDAPFASVTDTRANPAPSGFQADWRRRSASPTGSPLTNVPFAEPRSSIASCPSAPRQTRACRRESSGSSPSPPSPSTDERPISSSASSGATVLDPVA